MLGGHESSVLEHSLDASQVSDTLRLGIITVVDSKHIVEHLQEEKPEGVENESVEQLAFADRIIMNKTDLVSPEELVQVQKEVQKINSHAEIIHAQYSKVEPRRLSEDICLKLFKGSSSTSAPSLWIESWRWIRSSWTRMASISMTRL